ncbi:MAG: HAD family hydrolase [Thaumarchaeota archaeon]|nr:HAD family hydrolase [Nitrososphaerota archaeon]
MCLEKLKLDAVVFDLDGTLIDSSKGIHRCVREVLARRSYKSFDEEFLSRSIGVHPIDAIFQRTVRKSEVDGCIREFKQRYGRTLTEDVVLLDGAKETLDALMEEGYKVAVYTLKMKNHALKVLNHFSIKVHDILAGEQIGEDKSSGRGLKELLDGLGSRASKSAIVGDQWSDISAGKKVGMTTIAVLGGMGSFEELNKLGPDYLIGSVSDLTKIL